MPMFDEKRLLKAIESAEKYGVTMIFDEIMFAVLTAGFPLNRRRPYIIRKSMELRLPRSSQRRKHERRSGAESIPPS